MATISEALAIALKHHQAGRFAVAEQIYRQILQAEPQHAGALHLLGVMAHQAGQHAAAADFIGRAVAIDSSVPLYFNNLGEIYRILGRVEEAVTCCRRALQMQPDYVEAHYNLGVALQYQGKYREASACYRRALELHPEYADASNNLGVILLGHGRLAEAWQCCRQAIQHKPDCADAYNNLGHVLQNQGRLDEAIAGYRKALELRPDYSIAHSNILLWEQYRPEVTPARLAAVHAEWDRQYAAPLRSAWRPHVDRPDPQRPLRLGFVSSDFYCHPVGFFLVRILESLRAERCTIVCYSNGVRRDELTARFQAAAHTWREIHGLSDESLAQNVRDDGIDVLFDLAGHTADNRLLAFARKPAPMQITWLGYEGTTGLAAMDAILADGYEIPPREEEYYRERVLRMPDGYVCYDPPADAPPIAPLPAIERGYVTFASFNNPAKISPTVIEVWARILRRLPAARLVLQYRGMNETPVAGRFAAMLAAQGVDGSRVDYRGWSSRAESLAQYQGVDLALDPFPFSGSATTCDALWMGVPVVTCPGETFASRHSLSHLSNVGLRETIAGDREEYVEIAAALAADLPRLAAIRAQLRPQMAASPLCDGRRFARNLMLLLHSDRAKNKFSQDH
jgi:predicted O-linked N-acetylglucosamine transferase (SPINDLY family)